jgi:selenide,water dikinase
MIQGYVDTAVQANVKVGGGQSVYNMWPMLGGCAIAVVKEGEFRWPNKAQVGDVLVLTKPLGVRLAINTMQWLKTDKEKKQKMLAVLPESTILETFYRAEEYMGTLNVVGARLLRKYESNACTDVTGFGILGHANYLAQAQKNNVKFILDKLPILKDIHKLESQKVTSYKLFEGYAA